MFTWFSLAVLFYVTLKPQWYQDALPAFGAGFWFAVERLSKYVVNQATRTF